MTEYLCKEYDPGENPQYAEPWSRYNAQDARSAAEKYVSDTASYLPHQDGYVEVLVRHPDGVTFLINVAYETKMVFEAGEAKYVEL